jgi:hypothetical protein
MPLPGCLGLLPPATNAKRKRKRAVLALPKSDILRATSMVYLKSFLVGVAALVSGLFLGIVGLIAWDPSRVFQPRL